jgi:GNAT superfamily N-acetyltransferase
MKWRDAWQVHELEWAAHRHVSPKLCLSMNDVEFCLRQPFRHNVVAVDCHQSVRGWLSWEQAAGVCIIKHLTVHPDWWRMAIGRQLLEQLLIQGHGDGVQVVVEVPYCLLPGAANFFKAMHFEATSGSGDVVIMEFGSKTKVL